MKRNKKLWHKRKKCDDCKTFKTWGGIKKFFRLRKITQWVHPCKCSVIKLHSPVPTETVYNGFPTELDKEKCSEILRENKETKDENKRID